MAAHHLFFLFFCAHDDHQRLAVATDGKHHERSTSRQDLLWSTVLSVFLRAPEVAAGLRDLGATCSTESDEVATLERDIESSNDTLSFVGGRTSR